MKIEFWLGVGIIILSGFLIQFMVPVHHEIAHSVHEHREEFLAHKQMIIGELISKEKYQCCLAKPCTYCIEKTPKHGEGAECSCLEDIVNGRHPCGECIGEILEGHGNPYLADYFAKAIAEEVGEEHLKELQEIIEEKYSSEEKA
jgi:hypothetical protein